jgi:hypothetical protein
MPRSFRYDHFTAQKPNVSRKLKNKEKQRVATAEHEQQTAEVGLHYGRRHAETEELAKARAESVAHLPKPPAADSRSEDGPTAPPVVEDQRFPPREEEDVAQNSKVAEEAIDVAALPAPPQETTGSGFSAAGPRDVFSVFQEGVMQVDVLTRSVIDFGRAGLRLAQLSVELALLAAKSVLPGSRGKG